MPNYVNEGSTIGEYVILIPVNRLDYENREGVNVEPLASSLKEAKVKLEQNKTDLDSKNLALNELKAKLEDRKANLEDQTDAKQYILQQPGSGNRDFTCYRFISGYIK